MIGVLAFSRGVTRVVVGPTPPAPQTSTSDSIGQSVCRWARQCADPQLVFRKGRPVVHELKGFPDAIEAVFPQATVQTCLVHLIRRSLAQVSYKERRPLAAALKTIYRAPTEAAAEAALDALEAGPWGEKYPAIMRSWRGAWEHVVPFLVFSQPIRRAIYTTNAIESLNAPSSRPCDGPSRAGAGHRAHAPLPRSSPAIGRPRATTTNRHWRRSNRRKNPPATDALGSLKTNASRGSILSPSGSWLDPG